MLQEFLTSPIKVLQGTYKNNQMVYKMYILLVLQHKEYGAKKLLVEKYYKNGGNKNEQED